MISKPKRIPSKIKQTIDGKPLEYHTHQVDGIRWLAKRRSFLLGDDMGLGKTLQSLTVAAIDFDAERAERILVLCPPKLTINWQDEIERFTTFTCDVLTGSPQARIRLFNDWMDDPPDIVIAGYTMIQKHYADLNEIGFDICICDEAHELKNPKSKRWKGVRNIKARRWFMLTGTPLLNSPNEAWTILNRIDPDLFDNYWRFTHRYCRFGGFGGKQIVGVRNKTELAGLLNLVMLRREKSDVLDLPEKLIIQKTVGLSPKQRDLYDEAITDFQLSLPHDPDPMQLESAVTRFLRLKQICSTPFNLGFDDSSDKLDVAADIINELTANNHKVVVFTQFRGTLAAMAERLRQAGIDTYQLHGDVNVVDRQKALKIWGASSKPGVVLAMIQVAGVGLTMTAARHCVFVDKAYVPGVNTQAADRLHRIGASLTQPVEIIELICKGTVEDRVEKILATKQEMFDQIVNRQALNKIIYRAVMDEE